MKIYILLFTIVISINLNAQNSPPPEYLVEQAFPDSVTQLMLTSLDGQSITFGEILDKHAGQKVVIDFWASWCKDCIVGLPKLSELMKKTDQSEVDYVFLSLDKTKDKWKSAIESYSIQGDHYWIESGWQNVLSSYINLDWIPRYLVINEKGTIIMPKAILANDESLKKSLLE